MKIEDYLQQHKKSLEFDEPFNEMWTAIEGEFPKKNLWKWRAILGIVLLGSFLVILYLKSKEPRLPQSEIFAGLQSDQSGQRIWAVSQISDQSQDEEVIEALLYTLRYDESINVKIASSRALEKYIEHEAVRVAIIDMLETVEDSYLKIKLIHLLTRKKVKHAIPALDQLIDRNDTRDIVKEEATASKMELISL